MEHFTYGRAPTKKKKFYLKLTKQYRRVIKQQFQI